MKLAHLRCQVTYSRPDGLSCVPGRIIVETERAVGGDSGGEHAAVTYLLCVWCPVCWSQHRYPISLDFAESAGSRAVLSRSIRPGMHWWLLTCALPDAERFIARVRGSAILDAVVQAESFVDLDSGLAPS